MDGWVLIFGGNPNLPIESYSKSERKVCINDCVHKIIENFNNESSKLSDPSMQRY